MNLRELKIFLTVCNYKNMSKAAKILYMTQPAVSQSIADLEEQLGIKLFDRVNRRIVLTYGGEVLLEYSKRILILVDEAQRTLRDISNASKGQIRIGASTTIGTYLISNIIGEYKRKHSGICLPFIIDNTGVIEEMILDNRIDVGLVEGPVHSSNIIVEPFFDDELYLICSKNHHWAKRKKINEEEIKKEDLIIRESGSGTREVFEDTMSVRGIRYNITHVLNNTEAIKKAVEANLGIAFVSKIAVEEEIKSGRLVKIDIDNLNFNRKFNVIYHKDKFTSILFENFIDTLLKISKV